MPVCGLPEITPGCQLSAILAEALEPSLPQTDDVVVVTQKILSKAEDRFVHLPGVIPSAKAEELARKTYKDPRLVELALQESEEVVRAVPGVLITRHLLGLVMANSGIDRSNLGRDDGDWALLLPQDPDRSASAIQLALTRHFGCNLAVIISDSFGRPWRNGVTQVAIGAAGFPSITDRRGERDRDGRVLEATQIAMADMVACAAGLMMGEGAEGIPVALVRGLTFGQAAPSPASALVRPVGQDLFR